MKPIQNTPVILSRKRLQSLFALYEKKPVLFLSAAMGSGKTKAVEFWMEKEKTADKIWFTFPEAAEDAQWVWQRFSQAIRKINEELWKQLEQRHIPVTAREIDEFLVLFQKSIRPDSSLFLILDDYQECRSDAVKKVIKELCCRQIKGLHLVLLSREKPDVFFYEMELKGFCTLMEQKELDFTRQEVESLFAANHLLLAQEEIQQIYQYTEGWTASVYLMLLGYLRQEASFHLKNAQILLRSNVYDGLSDSWKESIKKLALLESFTKTQAAEVTQSRETADLLDYLERNNCFIRYNNSGKEYRLHTILREMLNELTQTDSAFCCDVWNRCGQFYAKQGDDIQALKQYGLAKNHQAIMDLMEKPGSTEFMDVAPLLIRSLFEQMPIMVRLDNPLAYLAYLSSYSVLEDRTEGRRLLKEFKELVSHSNYADSPELEGELLLTESMMCFNDMTAMCSLQKRAWEVLDGASSSIYGAAMDFTMGCPDLLFLYYREKNGIQKSIRSAVEGSCYFVKLCNGCGSGCAQLIKAQGMMYAGVLFGEELEDLLCRAESDAAEYRQHSMLIGVHFTRLRQAVLTGDNAAASVEERDIQKLKMKVNIPSQKASADISLGMGYALKGEFEKIPVWITQGQLQHYHAPAASAGLAAVVYGMVLIHEERMPELSFLLESMKELGRKEHLYGLLIYAQIFQSIAAEDQKKEEHLAKAVAMASPDRFWLPFAELSPYILKTLKRVTRSKELLRCCEEFHLVYHRDRHGASKEMLTGREREIMDCLCRGYTRTMIAEQLCISEYTVKRHISNIYEKLQVSSKAEAIKKIRE